MNTKHFSSTLSVALLFGALPICAQTTAQLPNSAIHSRATTSAPRVVQQARAFRLEGDALKSAEILVPVIRDNPNDYLAHYNLGLAYQGLGESDSAVQILTKAKNIREKSKIGDATIYNSLGWVLLSRGNYDEALQQFKTAEKPENFAQLPLTSQRKLLNNIAVAYASKGQTDLAKKYFDKAKVVSSAGISPNPE